MTTGKIKSYGSRASLGASKGPGPVKGAGQMPAIGPGSAAQKKIGRMPSVAAPRNAKKPGSR